MKKMFYILVLTLCLTFAGCSSGDSDSFYGSVDDSGDGAESSSKTGDKDSGYSGRPEDAPLPGGATGNGNGTPNGSSSDGGDSGTSDEDENSDDGDETDDSDSGTSDEDSDGNGENQDEDSDGNGENQDEDSDGNGNGIYASEPDFSSCDAGIPTDAEKQKVLARINYIRAIHNLKPVEYDEDGDGMTAECSLVIAANEQLSHQPKSSWKCYSQEAYDGCYSSNISLVMTTNADTTLMDSTSIVDGFLTDENEVPPVTLGHRRWMTDPWLAHISFGRADYSDGSGHFVLGSAIRVINRDDPSDQQDISDTDIKFVAYPFENYPAELYNDNVMMSFTVIGDKFSKYNNGEGKINLNSATVAIIGPDNKTMKIKSGSLATDYSGSGVPNSLRWYAEGIKPNAKYNVTILNVFVNNNPESYQYWFELK